MQKYTSANTSINTWRLPRIYTLIPIPAGSTILDYGCGKATHHIQSALPADCTYLPYDPYNLPGSKLPEGTVDIAVCSNVLNVIDDDATVDSILTTLHRIARTAYITVYQGDCSGIGRQTGPDQYQRNEPLSAYCTRLIRLRIPHTVAKGVITLCS